MKRNEYEPIKKVRNYNNKKVVFSLLTIIMCLGVSFSTLYFVYNYNDTRNNTVNSGIITLGLEGGESNVTLNNIVPMTDNVGKQNTPYTFTVENKSDVPVNARILLTVNSETTISLSSVKYAFYIDGSLTTEGTVNTITSNGNLVYNLNTLQPNDPVSAKIVFWIDYNYTQPASGVAQSFSATIKVDGESINYLP